MDFLQAFEFMEKIASASTACVPNPLEVSRERLRGMDSEDAGSGKLLTPDDVFDVEALDPLLLVKLAASAALPPERSRPAEHL